ncbi:MAG: hypothetical protein IPH16_17425 [Haliscomenobacter sp.]|nr:hypothetical protein [Haliscomenobacter sp.]
MEYFLTGILFWPPLAASAQASPLNTGKAWVGEVSYGFQIPSGDLSARFGPNVSLGAGIQWMSQKSNWLIGVQGQFLFGQRVEEDVLSTLRTAEGFIIGNDRDPADIQLRERGGYLGIQVGKLFSLDQDNPRSGLRISLGGGSLQHRIQIQKDPVRTVAQLEGDYAKGYDRLTNGPALYQWTGYQVFSKNRQVNFYIGLETIQGFTRGRRDWQFDLQQPYTGARLDLLWGIRAGLTLPIYYGSTEKIWY